MCSNKGLAKHLPGLCSFLLNHKFVNKHIALNPYSLAQTVQMLTNLSVGCYSGHSLLIRLSYRPETDTF